jgi:hypothetical protein
MVMVSIDVLLSRLHSTTLREETVSRAGMMQQGGGSGEGRQTHRQSSLNAIFHTASLGSTISRMKAPL